MKIKSIDKEVKEIFEANYFRIPRFQRPYSWDMENISEFWDDTIISDSDLDYFIGSMVVFKTDNRLHLVDGQQRLTTITMMLCALRNAMTQEGLNDLAEGIHQLIERKDIDNKDTFVISPETSHPYFQEKILKFTPTKDEIEIGDEEKNIQDAFDFIKSCIGNTIEGINIDTTKTAEKKKADVTKKLLWIRDKILGLKLILIELDNEDDAYIIFETLNTRGKDLSVSDLVKNHFTKLLKAKNRAVDPAKRKWEQILTTIGGSSAELTVDSYLHHFWLSKYEYVTLKKLFKKMKMLINKNNAKNFLAEFVNNAIIYREIHETNFRKWTIDEKEIQRALDALTVFRVKQQIPMVLAVMRDYKEKKLRKKDVETILSSIEKFHFIFTAVTSQRSSGGISKMYAAAARNLDGANTLKDRLKEIRALTDKVRLKIPPYEEFESNFRGIVFTDTNTKQKKLVRYILSGIGNHIATGVDIAFEKMTIEHIASQDNIGKDGLDESIIGQLGNLMLVSKDFNSEKLKDKSFSAKKEELIKSKIPLDQIIEEATKWTVEEIEKRTKWLAKKAYNDIWKI